MFYLSFSAKNLFIEVIFSSWRKGIKNAKKLLLWQCHAGQKNIAKLCVLSLNVYFYTELLERIAGAFLRLASPFQATLYQSFPVLWLTMLNLKRNLMISLTKSAKSVVRYAIFKMHIYQDYFTFFYVINLTLALRNQNYNCHVLIYDVN